MMWFYVCFREVSWFPCDVLFLRYRRLWGVTALLPSCCLDTASEKFNNASAKPVTLVEAVMTLQVLATTSTLRAIGQSTALIACRLFMVTFGRTFSCLEPLLWLACRCVTGTHHRELTSPSCSSSQWYQTRLEPNSGARVCHMFFLCVYCLPIVFCLRFDSRSFEEHSLWFPLYLNICDFFSFSFCKTGIVLLIALLLDFHLLFAGSQGDLCCIAVLLRLLLLLLLLLFSFTHSSSLISECLSV